MSELKRTQLYDAHVKAGATMVDFGGWEMPSLFDVSHMGRLRVEGPDAVAFLQHVLTSNVLALDLDKAQYCIIPAEDGSAVDDAYLYRFFEDWYLLVVNAANTDKDLDHLLPIAKNFDVKITNITPDYASIAVQGPKSRDLLMTLSGGAAVTEPMKNALGVLPLEGHEAWVAKTGYTGEPLGYRGRPLAVGPSVGAGRQARGPGRSGHPAPRSWHAPLRPRDGSRRRGQAHAHLRRVPREVRRLLLREEGRLRGPQAPGSAGRGQ